jgi:DNA-binding SARP family transcriptional activator
VLGPLEVLAAGRPVSPRGRQAALLVLLAAQSGATVSVDRLADALWPDGGPRDPANAVQILVSRLRARLGADLVETRPAGYRLAVDVTEVDAGRFEALVEQAVHADPGTAVVLLGRAEGLWRGSAYAHYDDVLGVRESAARLSELRLVARERGCRALVELGRSSSTHCARARSRRW